MGKIKTLLIPAVVVVGLWGLNHYYLTPQLESFLLTKLESYSSKNLPVTIKASSLHINLLKLSGTAKNISTTENKDLGVPAISTDEVRMHLDLLRLLSGQLMVSAVVVDGLSTEIALDPLLKSDTGPSKLPLEELFNILESVPIKRLILQDIDLKLSSEKYNLSSSIKKGHLTITNHNKSINARVNIPELDADLKKMGIFKGSISLAATLDENDLRINNATLNLGDSEISGVGSIAEFATVSEKFKSQFSIQANIDLSDLYTEFKKIAPSSKLPIISGKLVTQSDIRFNGYENPEVTGQIETKSVHVGSFVIGDANIEGKYKNKKISLADVHVSHPAGEVELKNSEFNFDEQYNFKSTLNLKNLELHDLFAAIDLKDVPVGIKLQGSAPCAGTIFPDFYLTCDDVTLSGQNLWIKNSLTDREDLFNIDRMGASGRVSINAQKVYYKAKVSLGDGLGSSEGVIDYEQGFNIKFESPSVDFKNVRNLAHLNLKGTTSIKGFTSGDSHAAIFDMNLGAKNFTFDQFYLGNISSLLKYRAGTLHFNDIQGAVNRSSYLGNLDVMLNDSVLQGEFSLPNVELADVKTILADFYLIPLEIAGTGKAQAKVYGPLDFWKLNYDLKSNFKEVMLAGEAFDKLDANLSALNGNIHFDDVLLKRGTGSVRLNGNITSEQELNMIFDGRNWRLEESPRMNALSSDVFGVLNFGAHITRTVEDPLVKVNGKISDTVIDNREIEDSILNLEITKKYLQGKFNIFNSRVLGELEWPLLPGNPLKINATATDWDFSSALALLGGTQLANEYESNLSAKVQLSSESGILRKASGSVDISRLYLKRGDLSFDNQGPLQISMENGLTSLKNFILKGPNTLLQLTGQNFTDERLAIDIKGNTDLRLLQIFTPFLEELGGNVKVSAQVRGSLLSPNISGAATGINNFLKVKGFPHPLEKLNADVTFSQNKILINSIKGQMAGGTVTGEGRVELKGPSDNPIYIRGRLENATLNVPDRVRSSGSADVLLTGQKLPYTLSGTYQANSAYIDKEFTESSGVSEVKQSRYLPRFIRESNASALILDLTVDLNKNIVVNNSLMNGQIEGRLQVKGAPENPILFGRIKTDKKAKVIFKDKVFDVQSGIIDFKDPSEINPDLYISATSHINDYDITLIAQGPSKNLSITLTSIPPLPEQDIISLIALGITSSAMEQNTQSRQQAEQVGAEIGGAVLAKPINKQLESTLGLNLSVTSDYDSTRNISVPKITLSRKLTDKMKVSGSRPVGNSESYDLKLEYILNNNITAIGSFETKGNSEDSNNSQGTRRESQSIFGLDLEFKREFK